MCACLPAWSEETGKFRPGEIGGYQIHNSDLNRCEFQQRQIALRLRYSYNRGGQRQIVINTKKNQSFRRNSDYTNIKTNQNTDGMLPSQPGKMQPKPPPLQSQLL